MKSTNQPTNIVLVGAGLVGSLLSMYLAKRGHNVSVYERRPDMRNTDVYAGRSINLALSDRGLRGLERIGLADEIKSIAIPMYGRMMHGVDSSLTYQPYGKDEQAINSVSRGELNKKLLLLASEFPNINFHFDERGIDCDLEAPSITFENTKTGNKTTTTSDVIIGSDGAFSAIRERMQKSDRYNFSQDYLEHSYKELTIPATENGEYRMEKNALHIWARKSFMMIALPNLDGSFTCTLFLQYEANANNDGFSALKSEQDVLNFFHREFPDAVPMMPTLLEDFFRNPTSSLVTMRAYPWIWKDNVALIGDAAHAIVPFYGQGMNCGFEDCVVMGDCLDRNETWESALMEYEQLRKPNGDAIAELALMNFVEMRDKVADPEFLLRKKVEAKIHAEYPDKFTPLYTLVTFSPDVPYSEALRRGRENDVLMDKVLSIGDVLNRWEDEEVRSQIRTLVG